VNSIARGSWGAVGRFLGDMLFGVRTFGQGVALALRRPRLLALGLLPAALAAVLLLGVFITVLFFIRAESSALTWFVADATPWLRGTVRVLAGVALVGVVGIVSVLAFSALALAIGDPFFEKISESVDDPRGFSHGDEDQSRWREWVRGTVDSLRLLALTVPVGIALFLAEFIPVFGQTVVPVLGALFAGWMLTLELTGTPLDRRGVGLSGRRKLLRGHRGAAFGFGVCVFVTFLIPLGAVLFMTPAVIGATLLVRQLTESPGNLDEVHQGECTPVG
jgi:CysZ protein